MFYRDSHGEYRVPDTWVDAWPGGDGHIAGWCICEVREYVDGTTRIHHESALYVAGEPEMAALHQIYLLARRALSAHKGRARRHDG